jgi:hypothetical protein
MKGTTDGIRKNVLSKALGNPESILVGKAKAGPFQPLKSIPVFRDLVVGPPTAPARSGKPEGGRPAVGLPNPGSKGGRLSSNAMKPVPPSSGAVPVGRLKATPPGDDGVQTDPLPPSTGRLKRVFQTGPASTGPRWDEVVLWIAATAAIVACLVGLYMLYFG